MTMPPSRRLVRRVAGSALVTAIFLMVVLAALAVALLGFFSVQQSAAALDEEGARAYQAARAGIEWGLFKQLRNGACASSTQLTLTSGSLDGFTVNVSCTQIDDPSDSDLVRYVIRATACNQPSASGCPNLSNNPDYVQRVLEVEI